MIKNDLKRIEALINELLVNTSLIKFSYAGIFRLHFESQNEEAKLIKLDIFTDIGVDLSCIVTDRELYLNNCRNLYEIYALPITSVEVLPENDLVLKSVNFDLHINSLNVTAGGVIGDRSWTISAKRGAEFIEIICDGKEELIAHISDSPII